MHSTASGVRRAGEAILEDEHERKKLRSGVNNARTSFSGVSFAAFPPPRVDVGGGFALYEAVQALLEEAALKTVILRDGSIAEPDALLLLDALLEASAPSSFREDSSVAAGAGQRQYQLASSRGYSTNSAAVPAASAYHSNATYTFSSPQPTAHTVHTGPSSIPEETNSFYIPKKSYQAATSYSFSKPSGAEPNEPDSMLARIRANTAARLQTASSFTTALTSSSASAAMASSLPSSMPSETIAELADFHWELGKITETFVPSTDYLSNIDWTKEKEAYSTKGFLLPRSVPPVQKAQFPKSLEFRYGQVPEIIVIFSEERQLRRQLWELHEVEIGKLKLHPSAPAAHRDFLETRYRSLLRLPPAQNVPLGSVHSPAEFAFPSGARKLLGKTFRFRGLGRAFNEDRVYTRDKLAEILCTYGFYIHRILITMPCSVLGGANTTRARELLWVEAPEFPLPSVTSAFDNCNLLILPLEREKCSQYRDPIPSHLSHLLTSAGFLQKVMNSPEHHKTVFVELSSSEDYFPLSLTPADKAKSRLQFDSFKQLVTQQYQLLLQAASSDSSFPLSSSSDMQVSFPPPSQSRASSLRRTSSVLRSAVEKIVNETAIFSVRPQLFLHLYNQSKSDVSLVTHMDIQQSSDSSSSNIELLSRTSVPALLGSIANMVLSKCAEPIRIMNKQWLESHANAIASSSYAPSSSSSSSSSSAWGTMRSVSPPSDAAELTHITNEEAVVPAFSSSGAFFVDPGVKSVLQHIAHSYQREYQAWKGECVSVSLHDLQNALREPCARTASLIGSSLSESHVKQIKMISAGVTTDKSAMLELMPRFAAYANPLSNSLSLAWPTVVKNTVNAKLQNLLALSKNALAKARDVFCSNHTVSDMERSRSERVGSICAETEAQIIKAMEELYRQLLVFSDVAVLVTTAVIQSVVASISQPSFSPADITSPYLIPTVELSSNLLLRLAQSVGDKFSHALSSLDSPCASLVTVLTSLSTVSVTPSVPVQSNPSAWAQTHTQLSTSMGRLTIHPGLEPSAAGEITIPPTEYPMLSAAPLSFPLAHSSSSSSSSSSYGYSSSPLAPAVFARLSNNVVRLTQRDAPKYFQRHEIFPLSASALPTVSSSPSSASPASPFAGVARTEAVFQPGTSPLSSHTMLTLSGHVSVPSGSHNHMSQQLSLYGLTEESVIPDQNAQFRALAHQVYKNEQAFHIVRLLVMSEILSNASLYEHGIKSVKGMDVQEYVSLMRGDQYPGDQITLCAFANAYRADVLIFTSQHPQPLLILCTGASPSPVQASSSSFSASTTQQKVLTCLSIIGESQYRSLIPQMAQVLYTPAPPAQTFANTTMFLGNTGTVLRAQKPLFLLSSSSSASSATPSNPQPSFHFEPPQKSSGFSFPGLAAPSSSSLSWSKPSRSPLLLKLSLPTFTPARTGAGLVFSEPVQVSPSPLFIHYELSGCTTGPIPKGDIEEVPHAKALERERELADSDSSIPTDEMEMSPISLRRSNGLSQSRLTFSMEIETQPKPSSLPVRLYTPKKLQDMCLALLAYHADALPPLAGEVPDHLIEKLLHLVGTQKPTHLSPSSAKSVLEPILNNSTVSVLDFSNCSSLSSEAVSEISSTLSTSLRSLTLAGCVGVSNDAVSSLAVCARLSHLSLKGCVRLSDEAISSAARQLSALQFLDISQCNRLTDGTVATVFTSCSALRTLCLEGLTRITDQAFSVSSASLTSLDITGCDSLTDQTLLFLAQRSISLASIKGGTRSFTDAGVSALAQYCKNITKFELSAGEGITDPTVLKVIETWPSITHLAFSGCTALTAAPFLQSLAHTQQLQSDRIFFSPGLNPVEPLSSLVSLDLSRCLGAGDNVLRVISRLSANTLQQLNISFCEDISDDGLCAVTETCRQLTELYLSKCVNITDSSVTSIASNLRALQKLSLSSCPKITDASILQLASSLSTLLELDLSSCPLLTDVGMIVVVQSLPRLQSLGLEECNVTEQAIFALGVHASQLTSLRVGYCKGITDQSLSRLAEGCPLLTSLDLSYCTQISPAAVRHCISRLPRLSSLVLRGLKFTTDVVSHPRLSSLRLGWCKTLQDSAVVSIANGCPSLSAITLCWASKLGPTALAALDNLPLLHSISLRGCSNVPVAAIKELKKRRPYLTVET